MLSPNHPTLGTTSKSNYLRVVVFCVFKVNLIMLMCLALNLSLEIFSIVPFNCRRSLKVCMHDVARMKTMRSCVSSAPRTLLRYSKLSRLLNGGSSGGIDRHFG